MLLSTKAGISPLVDNHFDATEQTELPYQVRIENFEGPLDLLLHLIKKSEINIYDIPIHLIAQQYLSYIEEMEDLNLTVAGEFLVMAATLLQIKSKMLLPADETAAADEEDGLDPRQELVRRLLEYKQFKDAARQLDEHERLWREIYNREQSPAVELDSDETLLDNVGLFDLVDALQGILARNPGKKFMEILPDNLTVRERMNAILEMLEGQESVNFVELFDPSCHRLVIIVTFLALLELMRLRTARVFQAEHFGPILVSRAFSLVPDPAEMDDAEWRGA
ncbi:MAG: segregation/condensation protein A [Nitrospirota bacterium]|nr:segregation/condensation protein A [Nitrospirota bacterium]